MFLIEMKKPRGCAALFIEGIFFLWHIQGYAVTHRGNSFSLGWREKKQKTKTRLLLEIMQILDAFSNKVGGEKNGDVVPQLETKAMWAKGRKLQRAAVPWERAVTARSFKALLSSLP